MSREGPLGKPCDAGEDRIGGLGPDVRLPGLVMHNDKLPNGGDQRADAAVDPAAELFRREGREPPFDEIEPRAVGRREVDVPAGVLAGRLANVEVGLRPNKMERAKRAPPIARSAAAAIR